LEILGENLKTQRTLRTSAENAEKSPAPQGREQHRFTARIEEPAKDAKKSRKGREEERQFERESRADDLGINLAMCP
jgi:hypothetical protein